MAHSSSDTATALLIDPQAEGQPASSARQPAEQPAAAHAAPGRSVYRDAADACLPRWVRINGGAPWLTDGMRAERVTQRSASSMYRQQAAGVAIGLTCELGENRPDREYLQEVVRTSLIRWQLSLRSDGCPALTRSRRSPLHGVTAHLITQLLNETTVFQTDLLLSDVERHLQWLIRRRGHTPWIEAATICALADGAVLVRDASLLKAGRRRLQALLRQQDEEGWFRERSGADIGRMSLTLDALARLHLNNGWDELAEPLRRATSFLVHL